MHHANLPTVQACPASNFAQSTLLSAFAMQSSCRGCHLFIRHLHLRYLSSWDLTYRPPSGTECHPQALSFCSVRSHGKLTILLYGQLPGKPIVCMGPTNWACCDKRHCIAQQSATGELMQRHEVFPEWVIL